MCNNKFIRIGLSNKTGKMMMSISIINHMQIDIEILSLEINSLVLY